MNRIWVEAAAVCLVALSGGCADNPLESMVPGVATLMVSGAHDDDGAMLLTLTGPGIGEPEAASTNHVLYQRRVSPDEVRVLVIGNLADGALLQVVLSDARDLAPYSATMVEVASRTDELRHSLSGYSLALMLAGQ